MSKKPCLNTAHQTRRKTALEVTKRQVADLKKRKSENLKSATGPSAQIHAEWLERNIEKKTNDIKILEDRLSGRISIPIVPSSRETLHDALDEEAVDGD